MCVLITLSRSSFTLLRKMCCPWCPLKNKVLVPSLLWSVLTVQNSWWKPFLCFVLGSWPLQGHGDRDEAFEIS